jgi:hypothetical protein
MKRPYVGATVEMYCQIDGKWRWVVVGKITNRCDLSGGNLFEYVNLKGDRVFGRAEIDSPFWIE